MLALHADHTMLSVHPACGIARWLDMQAAVVEDVIHGSKATV
jgi:hypothetical protein